MNLSNTVFTEWTLCKRQYILHVSTYMNPEEKNEIYAGKKSEQWVQYWTLVQYMLIWLRENVLLSAIYFEIYQNI